MAYKRKRSSSSYSRKTKARKSAYTRKRYRYGTRGKSKLTSVVKRTIMRMAEPKFKDESRGHVELYHNAGSPASGQIGNFITINRTNIMPIQGARDDERNGDQIYAKYFQIKMMLGHKYDRPNITWKIAVFTVPKSQTASMATCFELTTGHVILDTFNMDFIKKMLFYKVYKPARSTLFSSIGGTEQSREQTYPFTITIPRKKVYRFQQDTATSHNDDDIVLFIAAYDAYGTLLTDNIAYVDIWTKFAYADP